MKKDLRVYFDDIIESINLIEKYTNKINKRGFEKNELLQDAVIRRFQIIGEASKRIPDEFKQKHKDIPWRLVTGMRDVLIHEYSETNFDRIWNTVKDDLPVFKKQIEHLLEASIKKGRPPKTTRP